MLTKRLAPLVGDSELRMIIVIAVLMGLTSGLINNTAAVAVGIPLVMDLARRLKLQASRLLIPLSFFGMMGGTLTVIGTSTNILTSSILNDMPEFGREIGMFEFTHLGLIVLATGLLYFLTIGRLLMPKKDSKRIEAEADERFILELAIPDGSSAVGKTLKDSEFPTKHSIDVLKLVRGDDSRVKRALTTKIKAGDILQVRANVRQIVDLIKTDDAEVLSEFGEARRIRGDGHLVRVLLRDRRLFTGTTGAQVDFWKRYLGRLIGLEVKETRSRRLADDKLHVGEIVLMEVSSTALERLPRHADLLLLDAFEEKFNIWRMWMAAGIVIGVISAAVLTPLPIVVSALAGVVAMVLTRCIDAAEIYDSVSWDVIFLLAGVIPLGIAMTKSGAADLLANLLAAYAGGWHPVAVLMALYVVTTGLTELVSNNASAVILVPVAVALGNALQIDIFPLVLAVMFAASTSFLTPVGYQTNTMIYGTGFYRFTDFAKVGAPLNLLLMIVTCSSIWWFWLA
ncbi:MAG: SLC13 family permease [Woeseiaceae bacterium]|nr:SLC13 family permease [Woeseiaceae bacterium]